MSDKKRTDSNLAMTGLRPGWNDEGYFFHPDSEKSAADSRMVAAKAKNGAPSSREALFALAKLAANEFLIPMNDLNTNITIIAGFRFYEEFGLREVARIERYLRALPEYDIDLLPFDIDDHIRELKSSILANQNFLDIVCSEFVEAIIEIQQRSCPLQEGETDEAHYERCSTYIKDKFIDVAYEMDQDSFLVTMSSARSTIKQFVRDWSEHGEKERSQSYGPLLEGLVKYIPERRFADGTLKRILCPGSGLGRLPFEVLRRGYGSQGNEYAHSMLIGSDWILNHMVSPNCIELYPYALQSNNRRRRREIFRKVKVPDISPYRMFQETIQTLFPDYEELPEGHVFSMTQGEFIDSYDAEVNQWDGILCSFFIDTAQNIIQYFKTFARLIKPGGVLLSNGPLLYHYAESDNKPSIELAYDDLIEIIKKWFIVLEEKEYDANYTANGDSLMKTVYKTKYLVLRRRSDTDDPPPCEVTVKTVNYVTELIFSVADRRSIRNTMNLVLVR